MAFGINLKVARVAKGLSQTALGALLSPAAKALTICHWEQGKVEPGINRLRELCRVLDVRADELLGLSTMTVRPDYEAMAKKKPHTTAAVVESVKPSTTPKWSWDATEPSTVGVTLDGEEKRAIGPKDREKWSLSTCAKTIGCPSCGALKRLPCKSGRNCRGRLWALAAHRRRDVPVDLRYTEEIVEIGRVAHAGGFRAKFKNVDGEWAAFAGDDEISTIRDCALEYAIECGLVVLAEEEGAPVWKLSDRWLDERRVPHLKIVTNDEDIAKRDDEWVKSVH